VLALDSIRTQRQKNCQLLALCAYCLIWFLLAVNLTQAQTLTAAHFPTDAALWAALDTNNIELRPIIAIYEQGQTDSATMRLTQYFKEKSARRYFFDWREFPARFAEYSRLYPQEKNEHASRAAYQMRHFAPETQWRLPFFDLQGQAVSAYELRHLARQQRALDMALMFYYESEKPVYLEYFIRQVADLNRAFQAGTYDDAGNAIYESFRGGLRVQNWLFCHHAYLASTLYSESDQLLLIKTFVHHAAQLQKRTRKYATGNHHTRGLVALFEIAVCFPEFRDAPKWQKQALEGLRQHMLQEINGDGFQFERSIHYHKGDIENYLRVYQLARINGINLPEGYAERLRRMFESLVLLAQPDRRLPVLQDDTDRHLAESNELADVLTVGALIFGDARFKYFAADTLGAYWYWMIAPEQAERLKTIGAIEPSFGSIALSQTGYYVMRNGWQPEACYLVISAGLSRAKPDHQHADMLGIEAYAHGAQILPNYQVNYNDPALPFFKGSWVKNVALVDSLPQARVWIPNAGQSGFGKWADLPNPQVLRWESTVDWDYFAGTHDGFNKLGVDYFREVVFSKAGFWLIVDHFKGTGLHQYQQVWQGHYAVVSPAHIRKTITSGAALDIIQLGTGQPQIYLSEFARKGNAVFDVSAESSYTYSTLIVPNSSTTVWRESQNPVIKTPSFTIDLNPEKHLRSCGTIKTDATAVIKTGSENFWLFNCKSFIVNRQAVNFEYPVNLYLSVNARANALVYFGLQEAQYRLGNRTMSVAPAEQIELER